MVRAAATAPAAFQLFRVKDVIDALGASDASNGEADDTGHRRRLRAIMGKGANAATRRLATPRCSPPSTRAPHMDDFVGLVRRGLLDCEAIGHAAWAAPDGSRRTARNRQDMAPAALVRCLEPAVPIVSDKRRHAERWPAGRPSVVAQRSRGQGRVARTLLDEPTANPVILCDEFDTA